MRLVLDMKLYPPQASPRRCRVRSALFSALRLSASVPSALTPAAAASKSGLIRVISLSIHVHARLFPERAFISGRDKMNYLPHFVT